MQEQRRIFITGTDTNSGKTYVTCQLLGYFQAKQCQAQAIKPLVSGCFEKDGILVNEDLLALSQHNLNPRQKIHHKLYEPAIAPHLAAAKVGDEIKARDLVNFCHQSCFKAYDLLLIEGAGGLMVPLNDHETWINFLHQGKIPVILVVGLVLGCINHALLSAYLLQKEGIDCLGWIANEPKPGVEEPGGIVATLEKALPWPLLTWIKHGQKGLESFPLF